MELDPNIFSWDVHMVCEWLSVQNLSHLAPTFQNNEVDGSTLISLTPEDIRDELEIKKLADRKRLKESIEKLSFAISFADQNVSLSLMVKDGLKFAEENKVYENRGKDDANYAFCEQIEEYNKMEDVLQSGMEAFVVESRELANEANFEVAEKVHEAFESMRRQEFSDHNFARQQGGLPSLPDITRQAATTPSHFQFTATTPRSSSPSPFAHRPSSFNSTLFAAPSSSPFANVPTTINPLKQNEVLQSKNHTIVTTKQPHGKCIACLESNLQVFDLACDHSYCIPCTAELFSQAIKDHSLMPPSCCETEIDPNLAFELLDLPSAHEFAQHYTQVTAKNKMYCPNSRCSQFINLDVIEASPESSELQCPKCRTAMCTLCKNAAHTNLKCQQAKHTNSELDAAFENLTNSEKWKICTKCGRTIELLHGCNHITCPCKHEFCYTCGADWVPRKCNCDLMSEEQIERAVAERHPTNNFERIRLAEVFQHRVECTSHRWRHTHQPSVDSCENCGRRTDRYGYISRPLFIF